MWIRVALDKDSVHYNTPIGFSYVEGDHAEEYYFGQDVAEALEADGFLTEMWAELDALFDWGDCDFFMPDKCILFRDWLITRLARDVSPVIRPVYELMLDYAKKAIDHDTGISFDF